MHPKAFRRLAKIVIQRRMFEGDNQLMTLPGVIGRGRIVVNRIDIGVQLIFQLGCRRESHVPIAAIVYREGFEKFHQGIELLVAQRLALERYSSF